MITAAPDVATMAAEHDARSAEIERAESELAGMDAAREAAGIALDAIRAQIAEHVGAGARAGQRYAGRGAVSAIDSWGDDFELGVDELLAERTRLRAELARLDHDAAGLRASLGTWRAELASLESALLAALGTEPEPAAIPEPAPVAAPASAVRLARAWRPRPSHVARPAAATRPRVTTPPAWTWPIAPDGKHPNTGVDVSRPAPVAPAVAAGRPLATWDGGRVAPRQDPARGRFLAGLLAALLALAAGSLVTFALGGPEWFGLLSSFAVWMLAQAGANISRGRLTAAVNGRL